MAGEHESVSGESVGLYRRGGMTLDELQAAIDEAQESLASDAAAVEALGISADELRSVRYTAQTPSGLDPGSLLVLILLAAAKGAGAGAGTFAAKKAWSAILKRVRHEHGVDSLRDEDTQRKDQ